MTCSSPAATSMQNKHYPHNKFYYSRSSLVLALLRIRLNVSVIPGMRAGTETDTHYFCVLPSGVSDRDCGGSLRCGNKNCGLSNWYVGGFLSYYSLLLHTYYSLLLHTKYPRKAVTTRRITSATKNFTLTLTRFKGLST